MPVTHQGRRCSTSKSQVFDRKSQVFDSKSQVFDERGAAAKNSSRMWAFAVLMHTRDGIWRWRPPRLPGSAPVPLCDELEHPASPCLGSALEVRAVSASDADKLSSGVVVGT